MKGIKLENKYSCAEKNLLPEASFNESNGTAEGFPDHSDFQAGINDALGGNPFEPNSGVYQQAYTSSQRWLVSEAKRSLDGNLQSCIRGLENYLTLLHSQGKEMLLFRDQGTIGKIYDALYHIVTNKLDQSQPLTMLHRKLIDVVGRMESFRKRYQQIPADQNHQVAETSDLILKIWAEILEWVLLYIQNASDGLEELTYRHHKMLKIGIEAAGHTNSHHHVLKLGKKHSEFRPSDSEVHFQVAQSAFAVGDYNLAFKLGAKSYKKMRKKSFPDAQEQKTILSKLLAICANKLGFHGYVIHYAKEFADNGGNDEQLADILAKAHFSIAIQQGNRKRAAELATTILQQDINQYQSYLALFDYAFIQGDYYQAFGYLWDCMDSLDPANSEQCASFAESIYRMLDITLRHNKKESYIYWAQEFFKYSDRGKRHELILNHLARSNKWQWILEISDQLSEEHQALVADYIDEANANIFGETLATEELSAIELEQQIPQDENSELPIIQLLDEEASSKDSQDAIKALTPDQKQQRLAKTPPHSVPVEKLLNEVKSPASIKKTTRPREFKSHDSPGRFKQFWLNLVQKLKLTS